MSDLTALTENYTEIYSVDLQNNKKQAILVNLLATVIAAVMAAVMVFFHPFDLNFTRENAYPKLLDLCVKMLIALVGMIVYMILHELVHGITMKFFGTKKVKYGFTGLYAFAGSDDYYRKTPYLIIALAPIVVWGIVLAVINLLVPEEWFWVVWFIQIMNISGAAGDLYVTCKFIGLPSDILVKDYGVSMKVYSAKK